MKAKKLEFKIQRSLNPNRDLITMCILYFVFCISPIHAAFSANDAGTSGAAFLKIGAGARPTGMGEAFTAVADDANAIYWNTAGLATLKDKNEFVAMRAEIFQDLQYNFFAFAHPTKSWGTFAIGLNNLNITNIEQRTGDTDSPDSTFSSNDSAYTVAYAFRLEGGRIRTAETEAGLNLGIGLKYIRQNLSGDTANSIAFDLGSLYRFSERPLTLGAAIQNLGSNSKFNNKSDPLPLTIKLGTSYRIGQNWEISGSQSVENKIENGLLLAVDFHAPRDDDPSLRLGTEFTHGWSENLATSARGGYQTGRSRQSQGVASGVSAGAGVIYKFFSFDFSWVPFGDLGDTFRYSVKLRF